MEGAGTAVTKSASTRRDVLRVATGAAGVAAVVGAVGAAAYLVLDQSQDVAPPRAADAVDVDLSPLQGGQQVMVFWRAWPVFVVRRSAQALAALRDPDHLGLLADPNSEQLQQPPYARNLARSIKPELAVLIGVCTHMGCTPQFYPQPHASEPVPDWPGGYLCPCHGSRYDLAGRVFKDFPAPYNLPVPPHRFIGDQTIRIGENPANVKFDFNTILQI
jgi:ubiquinol-cytochrome c reductase iron-sulfur subunit